MHLKLKSFRSLAPSLASFLAIGITFGAFAGGPVDDSTPKAAAAQAASATASPAASISAASPGRPLGAAPLANASAAATKDATRTIPADENGLFATVLPTAGALAAVLVAILGAKWGAQRLGLRLTNGRRPSGVIEILAKYPITKGQQVMLLKVARRVLVVHQSGAGMRTLSELSSAEEVAELMARIEAGDRTSKDPRFEASLQSALKGDLRSTSRAARAMQNEDTDAVETIDLTRRTRRAATDAVIPNTAAIRRGLFGGRLA